MSDRGRLCLHDLTRGRRRKEEEEMYNDIWLVGKARGGNFFLLISFWNLVYFFFVSSLVSFLGYPVHYHLPYTRRSVCSVVCHSCHIIASRASVLLEHAYIHIHIYIHISLTLLIFIRCTSGLSGVCKSTDLGAVVFVPPLLLNQQAKGGQSERNKESQEWLVRKNVAAKCSYY